MAARHHGYDLDHRVIGGTPVNHEVLEVRLRCVDPLSFPLEKIRLRDTMRGNQLPQELKSDDVRALSGASR